MSHTYKIVYRAESQVSRLDGEATIKLDVPFQDNLENRAVIREILEKRTLMPVMILSITSV